MTRGAELASRPEVIGHSRTDISQISARAGQTPRIGILGDSLSDEYTWHSGNAQNWVQQLAAAGRINVGTWLDKANKPRGLGYENNWSLSGASTAMAIDNGQLAGLCTQCSKDEVDIVVILLGNDDLIGLAKQFTRGHRELTPAISKQIVAQLSDGLNTCLQELRAASADQILVCSILDWNHAPILDQLGLGFRHIDALHVLINDINTEIQQRSLRCGAVFWPLNAALDTYAREERLTIAGRQLHFNKASNNNDAFFLSDGIHPGTAASGLLANHIIHALNRAFQTGIEPLSETDIARTAGLIVDAVPRHREEY